MLRALPFIAVVFALMPSAVTATHPPRPESALDLIQIPWQQLGYEIVFMPSRTGFRAMTISDKHRIEIYARPQDEVELLAHDIAHELGHAVDLTYNTPEIRKAWMQLRGIDPETPWFGCNRCSDYNTPAGDFAESFAFIMYGPRYFRGRIALRPTSEQIPALSEFFPDSFRQVPPPLRLQP